VAGYETGVINDREVRAAAGIMFMLGMIVIFVGIGFNHTLVARIYLAWVFIDLTIRLFNPNYSMFMLLGRFFVQNQKPEYVGAAQKRFAWFLGWLIFIPMVNWFVIHWDISFYKVLLCLVCLTLIFLESAFGICVGCILYTSLLKKEAKYCPGGVCEIRTKEPIQTFNPLQKIITFFSITAIFIGIYFFLEKTPSYTFFGEFLHELALTDSQLEAEEEAKLEAAFENEDDF